MRAKTCAWSPSRWQPWRCRCRTRIAPCADGFPCHSREVLAAAMRARCAQAGGAARKSFANGAREILQRVVALPLAWRERPGSGDLARLGIVDGDHRRKRRQARALEAPTRTIADNSAGIIDPTKVVRLALENAVSVADVLLLSEATMTEPPELESLPVAFAFVDL